VFHDVQTLVPILLFNTFIGIDIIIRLISPGSDEYNRVILVLSFLLMPVIVALSYHENKVLLERGIHLTAFNWMSMLGTCLLTLGGIFLLLSRMQLGKYGGPKIIIEDDHELITTGMYRYIRYPMYSGFLLLFSGYSLALGSILMTTVISTVFFLLFKN
jgi:protein-S-isoprenylcysteine O-methyltransferase Ste14